MAFDQGSGGTHANPKTQIPNPKSQIPRKSQIPNPKPKPQGTPNTQFPTHLEFELGHSLGFGIWGLGFAISPSNPRSLHERWRAVPEIAAEDRDRAGAEPAVEDARVHRAEVGFEAHVAAAVLERGVLRVRV